MSGHQLSLADMASAFQLVAGASLAVSVFRAPYDRLYHKLGAILSREEVLLTGRTGDAVIEQAAKVSAARVSWLLAGARVEPIISAREREIWITIVLSLVGLIAATLYPDQPLPKGMAVAFLTLMVLPALIAWVQINVGISAALHDVKFEIENL